MTYDEFQRHLGKAGLKIHQFADLVKMNRISISNYGKKGEVPSHLAVIAALLGEMAERNIDYREILLRIDIAPKKPRGTGIGKFGGNPQDDLNFFALKEQIMHKPKIEQNLKSLNRVVVDTNGAVIK